MPIHWVREQVLSLKLEESWWVSQKELITNSKIDVSAFALLICGRFIKTIISVPSLAIKRKRSFRASQLLKALLQVSSA